MFKKDDYNTFYPSQSGNGKGNDNLEQFLRHLYEEQTIVFIGVSFNDRYLLNRLSRFYEKVKQNDEVGKKMKDSYEPKLDKIKHYAFMSDEIIKTGERYRSKDDNVSNQKKADGEKKRKREILEELRIEVVSYQKHRDWIDWFAAIRKRQREGKQKLHSVLSIEDPERIAVEGV